MLSSEWTKDISVVADINSTLLQGSNLLLERGYVNCHRLRSLSSYVDRTPREF